MNSQDIKAIHALIDAYFDGNTSLEDEKLLRRILASDRLPADDPQIEYARAVIGYTTAAGPRVARIPIKNKFSRSRIAVAAMTAISAAACLALLFAPRSVENSAIIYAHGKEVHNVDIALATMRSQMAEINSSGIDDANDAMLMLKEFGETWK